MCGHDERRTQNWATTAPFGQCYPIRVAPAAAPSQFGIECCSMIDLSVAMDRMSQWPTQIFCRRALENCIAATRTARAHTRANCERRVDGAMFPIAVGGWVIERHLSIAMKF